MILDNVINKSWVISTSSNANIRNFLTKLWLAAGIQFKASGDWVYSLLGPLGMPQQSELGPKIWSGLQWPPVKNWSKSSEAAGIQSEASGGWVWSLLGPLGMPQQSELGPKIWSGLQWPPFKNWSKSSEAAGIQSEASGDWVWSHFRFWDPI